MRDIYAILFALAVWAIGGFMTTFDNEFVAEVGRGTFYSTFLFYGLLVLIHIFTEKNDDFPFRFIHVAWAVSLLMPPVILLANPAPLAAPQIGQAIAMFASVWIAYWGCRYILEGGFTRPPLDERDEHEECISA